MKCSKCGYENNESFIFCPDCGSEVALPVAETEDTVYVNPVKQHLLPVLNSKLFLTLCILFTTSSACSVFSGNFNVIAILFTIFSWLVYSAAAKNTVDTKNLRCISGTVYAEYIINNVVSIILVVSVAILTVLFFVFIPNSEQFDALYNDMQQELSEILGATTVLTSVAAIALLAVFIVVAVSSLLVSLLGIRRIHRFVKSVYTSADKGQFDYKHCRGARVWLMVIGIFTILSSLTELSNIASLLFYSQASLGTAFIISSVLIKKYFSEFE